MFTLRIGDDDLELTLANSQDYVAWYNTYSGHGVIDIDTDLYVATPATNAVLSLADPPNLEHGRLSGAEISSGARS